MGQREKRIVVEWTPQAKEDLQEIYDYLYSVAGEKTADKIVGKLLLKTKVLSQFPQAGPREELLENKTREYRVLVRRNHKVIYYIEGGTVYISTIFDCRQNPVAMEENIV